jgi:hypothetical protein
MGRGMAKKICLVVATLMLSFTIGACSNLGTSISSTTPAGYPCTVSSIGGDDTGCYYFVDNGTAIACQVDETQYGKSACTNTTGNFYDYLDGTTDLCIGPGGYCSNSIPCSPKFTYNHLVNDGEAWQVVNRQQDQNGGQQPITANFTSTSSTTKSTTLSVSVTAYASAMLGFIFASVKAQVNASVVESQSTVIGNTVKVSVPAGGIENGIYGVSVQVVDGRLYQGSSCGVDGGEINYGTVQTYVPIGSGWCTWLSGHKPCRIVP